MHPVRKESERKTVLKEVHDIKGVCALPLPACCGINVKWKEVKRSRGRKRRTNKCRRGQAGRGNAIPHSKLMG